MARYCALAGQTSSPHHTRPSDPRPLRVERKDSVSLAGPLEDLGRGQSGERDEVRRAGAARPPERLGTPRTSVHCANRAVRQPVPNGEPGSERESEPDRLRRHRLGAWTDLPSRLGQRCACFALLVSACSRNGMGRLGGQQDQLAPRPGLPRAGPDSRSSTRRAR